VKRPYFTAQNLEKEAFEMLQLLERKSRVKRRHFEPSHAALLVLDMQDYFLDHSSHAFFPSAEAILPVINSLIGLFQSNRLPLIFTKHINTSQDAGLMAGWWKDLITRENPLSSLTADLDTSYGDVIQKCQYDAFHKTPLEQLLTTKGISQILISGVMTHLCCETTARSAFMLGFEAFFLIDATATYNEDFHFATLLNLSHGFAVPVLSKEIFSSFSGKV